MTTSSAPLSLLPSTFPSKAAHTPWVEQLSSGPDTTTYDSQSAAEGSGGRQRTSACWPPDESALLTNDAVDDTQRPESPQ